MIKKISFQHLRQKNQINVFHARFASNHQSNFNQQVVEGEDRNDATKIFLESITSTIKGITHINYTVEHNPNLTFDQKKGKKRFLVYRYNPAVLISISYKFIVQY